jgi:hypothetical protein
VAPIRSKPIRPQPLEIVAKQTIRSTPRRRAGRCCRRSLDMAMRLDHRTATFWFHQTTTPVWRTKR